MHPRRVVTWLLSTLAVVAVALVATDTVLHGSPGLFTILAAAVLVGTAAAWPMASRSVPQRAQLGPMCGECGYASWLSPDLGFCARCGSHRVWQAAPAVPATRAPQANAVRR